MTKKNSLNYFSRIYRSFYDKGFYNNVAYQQNNVGVNLLVFILFVTYLVPSLIIYNKFTTFAFATTQSIKLKELGENLVEVPEIYINNRELSNEDNINTPYELDVSFLDKTLLTFNEQENSLIGTNSIILFSKSGLYFDNMEMISILLNSFELGNIPLDKLGNNTNFQEYPQDNFTINGEKLIKWSESYINYLGSNVLFSLLPLALIAAIILKMIEIFILSLITSSLLNRRKIKLPSKKVFALTLAAMLPGLALKALDAFSLWSSRLISNNNYGSIIMLAINIYFIYFAVSSLQQNSSRSE